MVDIAQEAFQSKDFRLASEIYERIIAEKGPAAHLLIKLGNSHALAGQLPEAFTVFVKAYRLSKAINSNELTHLVQSLVKLARERMEAASTENKPSLLVDLKDILDNEPFLCGICLSTVLEPATIYCGHTFCRKCVEKSQSNTCIVCGKNPVVTAGFQPNVLLARVVLRLFPILEEVTHLKKLAGEQFSKQNYEETIKVFTKVITLVPDDHTTWSNRSYAHTKLHNYDEALADALRAIQLKPQWAKGYFRKGFAEELLGKEEEAALSYMKCLAIDQSAEQANTHLTQIIHSLLKPKMMCENPKHVTSPSLEPITELMRASSDDVNVGADGLSKVKALLDQQIQECDSVLQFGSEVKNIDASALVADMFECSLCYRLLYNPVTTPCGHVFCQHCLDRSMDHSVCCPQCRGNLAEYLAHRNKAITSSIQRILTLWFAKETQERSILHEQDLATFSLGGNTAEIPLFVCTMAFPTIPCPLHIFEPRYRLMMRQVMESGVRQFGMCLSTGPRDDDYAQYGTMLEINDLQFFDDGRSVVDTVGDRRFRVTSKSSRDGYNMATVEFLEDNKPQEDALAALQSMHDAIYDKVNTWFTNLPERISSQLRTQFGDLPGRDADVQAVRLGPKWVWWVTAILPVDPRAQLAILQMNTLKERLSTIDRVISYLQSRH